MEKHIIGGSFYRNYGETENPISYNDECIQMHQRKFWNVTAGELFHTHDFFEFDIIIDGEGRNLTAEGSTELRRGTLMFGTPSSMHSIEPYQGKPLTILNIIFVGELERAILRIFDTCDDAVTQLSEDELQYIYREASEVHANKGIPEIRYIARGAAYKIIAAVHRNLLSSGKLCRTEGNSKDVLEALVFIRKNYNKRITLTDVARHVNISNNYVGSLIKKKTGKGFMEYLLDLRLDNAYRMLALENMMVKEACENVGFSSYSNFYYAFTKKYGITPSTVRSQPHDENARIFKEGNKK